MKKLLGILVLGLFFVQIFFIANSAGELKKRPTQNSVNAISESSSSKCKDPETFKSMICEVKNMFNKKSISNLDTSNVKEEVKIDKALNEITKADKGELQLTDAVVNYFMQYVRGGHLKHPVDFYVATDGTNAIYWFCGETSTSCREGDSMQSIKICEKELGKKCKKFAVRRTIKWKNGINPAKGKVSTIKSKWSDAEIKAKLTELGFYNNTILTLSKPKIIKKEKPKKHNSLWQKIKSKIKIN